LRVSSSFILLFGYVVARVSKNAIQSPEQKLGAAQDLLLLVSYPRRDAQAVHAIKKYNWHGRPDPLEFATQINVVLGFNGFTENHSADAIAQKDALGFLRIVGVDHAISCSFKRQVSRNLGGRSLTNTKDRQSHVLKVSCSKVSYSNP